MQIYEDPEKQIQHFIQHGVWWNTGFVWTFMLFEHSWCWKEKIVEWCIEWNLNKFKISSNISSNIWVLKQYWIRLCWQSNKLDNLPRIDYFSHILSKNSNTLSLKLVIWNNQNTNKYLSKIHNNSCQTVLKYR